MPASHSFGLCMLALVMLQMPSAGETKLLPGDKGLLWGILREGYLEVSCCLAIWIAEPNWMVPARSKSLPASKFRLHHFLCSGMING